MRLRSLTLVSLLVGSVGTAQEAASPEESVGMLVVTLGQRSLDEDLWEPLEDQLVLGAEFVAASDGALTWEGGLSFSFDDTTIAGADVTGTTYELAGGLRWWLGKQTVRPYLGVGAALIGADLEAEMGGLTVSDDDSSLGFYAHGGAAWRLAPSFFLGADVRVLTGSDVDLFGVDGDADYVQLALTLGWLL